jgi:hypothetical protein
MTLEDIPVCSKMIEAHIFNNPYLMTLIAVVLSMLYSRSFRVWLGEMTIDSPVWMPSGSTFSMLQT